MRRKQFLTLVLVLVTGVVAGALLVRFVESAKAQSSNTRERWEYCAITRLTSFTQGNFSTSKIGSAQICYFEFGCREEAIEVSLENSDFEDAKNVALGRAVAKLGQQGWQMVGEGTFRLSTADDRKALYFRRLQR